MDTYKNYFVKAIKDNYSINSDLLLAEIEKNFEYISGNVNFAATSSNPLDKRLGFCGYFLALIKTLDEQGETFETIRRICLIITTDYVRPKNKIHLVLKRFPAKLSHTWLATVFLKMLHKRVSKKGHPDGFLAQIITDKKETFGLGYGVDILECGICKLFKKYNYEKYSSILCEVDELTSHLAGLNLIRTGTIALGATKCDFRFTKKLRLT